MKKIALIIALILTLSICIVLSACDGGDKTTTTAQGDPDLHTHEFGEWTVTIEPTCTEKGEETRKCSCGETETRPVDATGVHKYNSEITCSVCGYCAYKGVVFTWSNGGFRVTYYTGNETEVIIPSVYKGNPVTSIGDWAFGDCTSLESVTIGNSVTSIGDYAFSGCTSLESVTIGNSVTSIGYFAFKDCTSLVNITIPDSVTSIGDYAFKDCTSLETINYSGTKIHWIAISKGSYLNDNTGSYTVYCTDGNISK